MHMQVCMFLCTSVSVCVHARKHAQVLSASEVNSTTPKAPDSTCYHTERTISSSLFDHLPRLQNVPSKQKTHLEEMTSRPHQVSRADGTL